MITRVHRFHGHASLPSLYRRSNTVRNSLMSLKYARRNRPNQSYRLAVIVSRKVSKSAVVRNRIRRRLYEFVRLREAQLNGSYDIAITVYSSSVALLSAVQLENQLIDLFSKAGMLAATDPSHAIVKATGK